MEIETILKKINEKFKNDVLRLNHILGVYRKAIELARLYKVDIFRVQVAALLHDYTKNETLEFHLSLLKSRIINKYKQIPFHYHAWSSAVFVQKFFKIDDVQILNAIRKHVWGHLKMTKLDKIIFISDKIENNRNYPQINYFRKLAFENLDQTIYKILKSNIEYYHKKNSFIFIEQLEIFNFFKKKLNLN